MKKSIIGIVGLWLTLALASCHHEPASEEKDYLDGSPTFTVDAYLRPGMQIEVEAGGVTHPEGLGLGFYWTETISNQIDTVRTPGDPASVSNVYRFTVPDTTGTFQLRCSAYADGYYISTGTANFVVVKTGLDESLAGRGIAATDPHVADARETDVPDGENQYYYTSIGELDWMRNNLSYSGTGHSFRLSKVMDALAGRFYTWEEAQTACPDGWRLPTDSEWAAMVSTVTGSSHAAGGLLSGAAGALMGDAYFNGNKMWEFWPEVKISNSSKLAVVPFGYALVAGEKLSFIGASEYAAFWLADTAADDAEKALYRYIYVKQPDIYLGQADKSSFAASVRCVRETATP